MLVRVITISFVILCWACRSGDIPCPTPQVAKMKKSHAHRGRPEPALLVDAREHGSENRYKIERGHPRDVKSADSIEEWDCPKPGMKKTPKSVKDNIKKNKKKMREYFRHKNEADSLQTVLPDHPGTH